jgi:hypothetical protein
MVVKLAEMHCVAKLWQYWPRQLQWIAAQRTPPFGAQRYSCTVIPGNDS